MITPAECSTRFIGSPLYFAPEMSNFRQFRLLRMSLLTLIPSSVLIRYTNKVDIWALGVIAYELIVHVPPFNIAIDREGKGPCFKYTDLKAPEFLEYPPTCSPWYKHFICCCLQTVCSLPRSFGCCSWTCVCILCRPFCSVGPAEAV
jgi:serine/threonine protein kinase